MPKRSRIVQAINAQRLAGAVSERSGNGKHDSTTKVDRKSRVCERHGLAPMSGGPAGIATVGLVAFLLAACGGDDSSPGLEQGQGGTPAASGGLPGASGGFDTVAGGTPGVPGAGGAAGTSTGFGGSNVGGASTGAGGMNSAGTAGSTGSGGQATGGANAGGEGNDTGGAAADGGMGGTGAGGESSEGKPPCLEDASQLVMIGDSYINWISHTFPTDMNQVSGLEIGNYAIGGTSMGSGGIGLIPTQFDTALASHPDIIAVIMDGGGNDVLVPDIAQFPQGGQCKQMGDQSPSIPNCQAIVDKGLQAGVDLFLRMAKEGVKDTVFFFYPRVPKNTVVGGADPNGMLDYALPKIRAQCEGAYELSTQMDPDHPIRCHFVDMVPVFENHPEYFAPTDIHPNSMGSRAMAETIWAKMKEDCIAQPASSGCCAP